MTDHTDSDKVNPGITPNPNDYIPLGYESAPGYQQPELYPQPVVAVVQTVDPTGVANPRRGALLVGISVLAAVLVALIVALLFFQGMIRFGSKASLANGIKLELQKMVVIELSGEVKQPPHPYSVFLPKGEVAVFAPVGDKVHYNVVSPDKGSSISPREVEVSWPDGDGSGGSLGACPDGERYVLDDNQVTCGEIQAPESVAAGGDAPDDDLQGEVLHQDEDVQIVASPGVDNAKVLSGYSLQGELLWSQTLDTPGQVATDGENIVVTRFGNSQVSIEAYGGTEPSQKPTDTPTPAEAAKKPDKDAIKKFDYKNALAPNVENSHSECAGYFLESGTFRQIFQKIPDTKEDNCWVTMVNGKSQELDTYYGDDEPEPLLKYYEMESNDAAELIPQYQDMNGDGYTDLYVFAGLARTGVAHVAYIFDPEDSEHPYVTILGSGGDISSYPQYRGNSLFETESGQPNCILNRFRIENDVHGVPTVVDYHKVDYNAGQQCL